MDKNKSYVGVFINNPTGWRLIQTSGGTYALLDNDGVTLHFSTLQALGDFAERIMDIYNDNRPPTSEHQEPHAN